jgi:hypothetical protein
MEFLEFCDKEILASHEELEMTAKDNSEREMLYSTSKHGRRLMFLVDGIALDLETGNFCKLDPGSHFMKLQYERTYMKDYEKIIAVAHSYSQDDWNRLYTSTGGGQSRGFCNVEEHKKRNESCPPDGLDWRKKDGDWFLAVDKKDACSGCTIIDNKELVTKKAVDCIKHE